MRDTGRKSGNRNTPMGWAHKVAKTMRLGMGVFLLAGRLTAVVSRQHCGLNTVLLPGLLW